LLLVNSDGAASHFKQKYTIQFLCKLYASTNFQRIIWNFGCPGHGKGVWDGIGALVSKTCEYAYDFPMIFLWFSYDFPMGAYETPMKHPMSEFNTYDIPMVPYGSDIGTLQVKNRCLRQPMTSLWFPYAIA
jgi:hypothetical protein